MLFNMTPMEFAVQAAAVAAILLWIRRFRIDAKKKGFETVNDLLRDGIFSVFKFVGSMSTTIEVISLAFMAITAGRMGLFAAVGRFGLLGLAEVYMTFLFISMVYRKMQDYYENDMSVSFWEKVKIVFACGPYFIMGLLFTYLIALTYVEAEGGIKVVGTGSLMPWDFIHVTGVPDVANIEMGALFIIFFTPLINIATVAHVLASNDKSIKEMLKTEKFGSNSNFNNSDGRNNSSNGGRSSGSGRNNSNSGGGRSNPNPNRGAGGNRSNTQNTNNDRNNTTNNDHGRLDTQTLDKYVKSMKEAFSVANISYPADKVIDGVSVDPIKTMVMQKCGINPANPAEMIVVPGVTDEKVAKLANRYVAQQQSGGGQQIPEIERGEMTPLQVWQSKFLGPSGILEGDFKENDQYAMPIGVKGFEGLKKQYENFDKAIEEKELEVNDAKRQLQNAVSSSNTSETSRLSEEIQNLESALNRMRNERSSGRYETDYRNKVTKLVQHFKRLSDLDNI